MNGILPAAQASTHPPALQPPASVARLHISSVSFSPHPRDPDSTASTLLHSCPPDLGHLHRRLERHQLKGKRNHSQRTSRVCMAPSKLRQALGAAKDQTTIALARVGGADDEVAADVEVAIVRATAHGEALPADDRHVAEILALTRYSRARVAACVASVARRLGRTRTWPVAVKVLALVHRLLVEGDPAFEQEVFLATRRGRRMLDMSRFRDRGRARSRDWDFAAFVHAYAVYLDDRLKCRMQGRQGGAATPRNWSVHGSRGSSFHDTADGTGEVHEAWPATETGTEDLVAKAQQLKHLLNRFIECRPTGKARTNRVVTTALYRVVKESAAMYCELTEVMVVLMDRFAELDTPACVRVHSIFTSLAKLVDELDDFYAWCKATAVCRPSDVPEIQRVRQKNLDLMGEFIRDRLASASQRCRSPPAPLSSPSTPVRKYDAKPIDDEPVPEEQQVTAREENNTGKAAAAAELAGSLVVVDDKMANFLNLDDDTSPPSGEEHGRDLTLALFDGCSAEATASEWVAFDDPSEDWETALVQSTSRPATRLAELGGGFNTTVLDAMYSHAAANATVTNSRAFAGSASSVATQTLGATALALPPPPGAAAAAGTRTDPFAASLAVPPPTYVQMTDLRTRQRLLVQEQNAWQQYERQRAPFSYNLL